MEGLRKPEARETEARDPGVWRAVGMMGEHGRRQQAGVWPRIWSISVADAALKYIREEGRCIGELRDRFRGDKDRGPYRIKRQKIIGYTHTHAHTLTHTYPLEWWSGSVASSGTWVGMRGVISWCRFQYPIYNRPRDA